MRVGEVLCASVGLVLGCLLHGVPAGAASVPTLAGDGFVENRGQWPGTAKFFRRLGESAGTPRCRLELWLTETGYTTSLLDLSRAAGAPARVPRHAVSVRFAGGSRPVVEATEPLGGTFNWLAGSDRSRHAAGVRAFRRVVYRAVYPGIDVVFDALSAPQLMETSIRVAPGADPTAVALAVEGATSVRLDAAGNAVLATPLGDLTELAPRAFQTGATGRREPVAAALALDGSTLRFEVGPYDRERPLVIDPVVVFSRSLGGSGTESLADMFESAGSRYISGVTSSPDFPATTGASYTSLIGAFDWYVAKLARDTLALVFATYLGGNACDHGGDSVVAPDGSIYVAGTRYRSGGGPRPILPVLPLVPPRDLVGAAGSGSPASDFPYDAWDVAVTRLAADGSAILADLTLGSDASDYAGGIAIGRDGSVYVCGATFRPFAFGSPPAGAGAASFPPPGSYEAFVARLTGDLSTHLATAIVPGGPGFDGCSAVAVDAAGDVYAAGATDAPIWRGTATIGSGGSSDLFVAKYDPTLTSLRYATRIGGAAAEPTVGWDYLTEPPIHASTAYNALVVDSAGRAWVTGMTASSDFPTTAGTYRTANAGSYDAFVLALAAAGDALDLGTLIGGSGIDSGRGLALDSAGRVYVVGSSASTDYPVTPRAPRAPAQGGYDLLLSVFSPDLAELRFSTLWGGISADFGAAVTVGPDLRATVAGFSLGDFPQLPPDGPWLGPLGGCDAVLAAFDLGDIYDLTPRRFLRRPRPK